MRKIVLFGVLLGCLGSAAQAQVYVEGYTRRDGTYVAPHYRSAPDGSRFNNYSTQGNVNPYTGQVGTVNPYYQPPPQPNYGSSYGPTYRPQSQYGSSYGR